MLLLLILLLVQSAKPPDRIVGLLKLPEVFGNEPCERFVTQDVTLYDGPDSTTVVGEVRVDRHWSFAAEGGCEGLSVKVYYRPGTAPPADLPTREYGYETPAAIVLENRGRRFRLQLDDGSAWMMASERDEYLPLEKLLVERLTHLTDEWDGLLRGMPAAPKSFRAPIRRSKDSGYSTGVKVLGFREVGGELWLEVEVLSHHQCVGPADPATVARGWIPAHTGSGALTVWFSSRGC